MLVSRSCTVGNELAIARAAAFAVTSGFGIAAVEERAALLLSAWMPGFACRRRGRVEIASRSTTACRGAASGASVRTT